MKSVIHNLEQLRGAFSSVALTVDFSKPQLFEIKPYKPPRTSEQNALMHVLWRQVANHVGRSEDEIKEIFIQEFGPEKVVDVGTDVVVISKRTSEYNKNECSDMIEVIYQKGAEWGVEFTEAA